MLADEPTGNLDTRNGRHIMDLLRKIHRERGTTIVLVTHDAELASMADARLVLRDGRVVESAEHDAGAPMRFVLRMAVRETRASWTRLLFFFLCIAVGVAAIVTLRSVIQSVRGVFGREAKALIAADVLVSSNVDWTPETRQTIDRRFAEFGAEEWTESVETPTMSRPSDGRPVARMVELRAVQPAFPLYGTRRAGGRPDLFARAAAGARRARAAGAADGARPEGRRFAGHRQGDLHDSRRDYDRAGPPRRRFQPGAARADRLRRPGVDRSAQRRQPRAPRPARACAGRRGSSRWSTALRSDFREQFVAARSYRSTDDEVGRDFDRAENYLSLVGLVIVILGGIAVSSVTRVFILQKIRSIAVLKCLGARSDQIMWVYVLQVVALGLAGSVLGVALARATLAAIPVALGGSTSILAEADYGLSWSAAAQGIAVGILVSLLFSVVPLMQVRYVKPSLLLRDETAPRQRDWTRIAVMVLVSLGLVAVAGWQAGSLRVGAVVCCGFAALAVVLQLAGRGLIALLAPLALSPSFPLRHAVLHLSRPGNQTRVVLFAVGLGAFFVVGVRSLQASLLEEFSVQISEDAPDMFLIDIQREQVEGVRAFLADARNGAGQSRLIPVLRARVTGVTGRETNLETFEDVRARGSLAREYTITYRDHLEPNERIVAGAFWTGSSPDPEVSVEQGIHERFAINVGDTMRFDILGRADQRARDQHPRGRLARLAQRRLHVRVPAGRARAGAADLHRAAQRRRTTRRRAPGSSTTWSSSSRTSR